MSQINPWTLFDDAVQRGASTVVSLDRPLDIAPESGTTLALATVAGIVGEAAGWLAAAGAGPGDSVAIVKDNHWDSDLLAYAAIRAGAVPAKLRSDLPPASQEILLGRLRPAVTVTTTSVLAAAREAGVDLAAVAGTILTVDGPAPAALSLDELRGAPAPSPRSRADDAPLIVCATSGTTGVPKLVVHSTATIIRRLAEFEARRYPFFGCRPTDVVASASAFSHGRTFCWTAVAATMAPREIVIVSDHAPDRAASLLAGHPPTILEGLPSTFVRWTALAGSAANPFGSVRLYVSTYDAIHPPALRAFLSASREPRVVFMHGWGQSETGPLAFRLFTRKALAARGERSPTTRDHGMPTPIKTRLRVVDPQTLLPLPRGRCGVILARTRARCLGYVGEPERFAAKLDGTWFNTGDLGRITRRGSVVFVDREIDGVGRASCLELEDVIDDRLDDVLECVILGERDGRLVPVLVTADGEMVDENAWRVAVADLPALDEPVVMTWDEVPRTGTGKVQRWRLRAQLAGIAASAGTGRWT